MIGRERVLGPLLLAVLALLASLVLARSFPLVDPDEGRNAEIAREIAISGDLVVPHLAGMPYLDKPPAFFWAAALVIRVFGATPLVVRLPSALAAFATLIVIAGLATWSPLRDGGAATPDSRFALRAVGLLAAAPLFAVLSAYVIFDMALTLCVTIVWTELVLEIQSGPSAARRMVMFAAVTTGVLIKGPVMIAWAVGGSLLSALLLRGRKPLEWLAWWPGWLMVFGIAGGWFALASSRYPEYPRYAFLEETFERVTGGSFHRQQPLWFVPAVLAGGALPWSLTTPWGRRRERAKLVSVEGRPRTSSERPGSPRTTPARRVALGFLLFAALFFTLSRSKLVTYLLPVFPMMAWLAAEAWSDTSRTRRGAWSASILYGAFAIALGLPALLPRALAKLDDPALIGMSVDAAHRLAIAFALLAVPCAAAAWARWRDIALVASLLFTPLVFFIAGPTLARYAAIQSGAPLADAIVRHAGGQRVRFESCYSPGTDFTLGRRSDRFGSESPEIAGNYQARYRALLMQRGQWTALDAIPHPDSASVVVRSVRAPAAPPAGMTELFRDRRFVAYLRNDRSR